MLTEARPRLPFFRRRRDRHEDRSLTRESVPRVFFGGEGTAGEPVSTRNAMALADCWACVAVYARMFAMLPWHHYRRGDGGRTQVENSTLARLLRNPAAGISPAAWRGYLGSTLALHGEAFIGLYRDADEQVSALGMLDPLAVEVKVEGGEPLYRYTSPEGRTHDLTEHDVVHVRGPLSIDGLRGASPIKHCRLALATAGSIAKHGDESWASGGIPPGVLTIPPGPGAEDQRRNLDSDWHARKRGRVAVLTGDVQFSQVGLSNADAQFIESAQWSAQTVARVFGLPPWSIYSPSGDSMTYANVDAQMRALVVLSMSAWFTCAEEALSSNRELCPGGSYAHIEVEGVMRTDPAARAAWYTAALNPSTGWATRAEVREWEDLPAEPERPATPESEEAPHA